MYRAHLFSGVALMALVLAATQAQAQTAIELETINVEGESQATTRGDGDVTNDEPTVATKEETVLTTRVTRGANTITAIVTAATLYVLRCLIGGSEPVRSGCVKERNV